VIFITYLLCVKGLNVRALALEASYDIVKIYSMNLECFAVVISMILVKI
jgi:hypothetical protein